jgi:co-chaperonin GroES (HSP10)
MNLRPLGHRIHIKPDAQPTQTEGGLYIPDAIADDVPPMSGIVTQIGNGPYRDQRIRTAAIARCLAILDDAEIEAVSKAECVQLARDEMCRYLHNIAKGEPTVQVGDRVVFPMDKGHEIVFNEDNESEEVILNEDDVLAVYDAQESAA